MILACLRCSPKHRSRSAQSHPEVLLLLLTLKAMETRQRGGSCPATAAGIAPTALGWGRRRRRKALQPACSSHSGSNGAKPPAHAGPTAKWCQGLSPPRSPAGCPHPSLPLVGQDQSKSCSQNYPCRATGAEPRAQGRRNPSGYLGVWAGRGFHPGEDRLWIRNARKRSALPQLGEPTHPVKPDAPWPRNGDLQKRHLCR